MAERLIYRGKGQEGCQDMQAMNYNPLATYCNSKQSKDGPKLVDGVWVNGCCKYSKSTETGCMDSNATNFDDKAVISCKDCCKYDKNKNETNQLIVNSPKVFINPASLADRVNSRQQRTPGSDTGDLDPDPVNCQEYLGQYVVDPIELIVYIGLIPILEQCCDEMYVGQPVYWDHEKGVCRVYSDTEDSTLCESINSGLISQAELDERILCIDCDNFIWWDNLYTTINGASLQEINQPLWDFLVSIITNDPNPATQTFNSGSFYVDILTGEPIVDQDCCELLENSNFVLMGNFDDADNPPVTACLCNVEPEINKNCECLTDIDIFMSLASTIEGRNILLSTNVLSSLGLNGDEIGYVVGNLFNTNINPEDNIPYNTYAITLISNALYITGGIYICYTVFGEIQTSHEDQSSVIAQNNVTLIETSETDCQELGGYWDGAVCFCISQDVCNLQLTDLETTVIYNIFNEPLTVMTFNGQYISKECCLEIANNNNLDWVYGTENASATQEYCFTKDPNPCLPLIFNLNQDLIQPQCNVPLDISASIYFGTPENPCIITDDDEVIIVDDPTEPCLLEFDEHNNLINYNSTTTTRRRTPIELEPEGPVNPPDEPVEPPLEDEDGPCCYSSTNPILANLVITNDSGEVLHNSQNFNISPLETWVTLFTQFSMPLTGSTSINVGLQITNGLSCCCVYDIFLDNLQVNCTEETSVIDILNNECPGFDIVPVIDNKKSWVYNPGEINYSKIRNQSGALTDNIIIQRGDFGLIQGYGTINRYFAPSPDADLEWRYTDYWKQSSILEKHSNLVLNSKELILTFDMCNIGGPCPDGYTLSAGTETCYRSTIGCLDGYVLSGGTCYSGDTCCTGTTASTINIVLTENSDPLACKTKLNLLELENYKKTFQTFWVQFIEQFVPATTIFVSGERWCNRPDEICAAYEPCDFDFEFVEGDVTTIPNDSDFDGPTVGTDRTRNYTPSNSEINRNSLQFEPLNYTDSNNGPIYTDMSTILPLPSENGEIITTRSYIPNEGDRRDRVAEYRQNVAPVVTITLFE